ncbi:MAG: hypothetical protein AB7U45_02205 [Desulfamplus sp.]
MKLEAKDTPESFVDKRDYMINLVLNIKNKTSFFPDLRKQDQGYYRELYYNELIEKIKEQYPNDVQLVVIKENQNILYVIKKGLSIFICEGSGKVSVSQIKMEFNEFMDNFQHQSKYKKFFSSIFDW